MQFVKPTDKSVGLYIMSYLLFLTCACAAASLATGTLKGEQET